MLEMSSNVAGRLAVLSMYRRLLRLHQHLPLRMQQIGTGFVKTEFKNHKNASEEHARKFMKEWTEYARDLEKQFEVLETGASSSDVKVGTRFTSEELDLMSDEQIRQLHELHKETSKPSSS